MQIIRTSVENPEELLNASAFGAGALVRLESCATETGTYAELGTMAIVAGTRTYTFYDASGAATTWYRSRYSTAAPLVAADYSAYSAVFQAGGDEGGYVCSLYDVKQALKISATDATDDEDLLELIRSVSEAVETVTGRWYAPRTGTYYFDAGSDAYTLDLSQGVASVTYLGVATTDQPDGGTGTYTSITSGYYLDPPLQDRRNGAPATRLTLSTTAAAQFPTNGERRAIKVTCALGATSARVSQIAISAIVRAYRARSSGGADFTIVGPDGGMKILRDFAPSETEELRNAFGVPLIA